MLSIYLQLLIKMAETVTIPEKEYSKENFVKDGKVYILGPFDRSISKNVIPEFMNLIGSECMAKDPGIPIYINSYGGFASELISLLSIIDLAKSAEIPIMTYNLGVAFSCGSLLAVYGDKRYMGKHATNLMHLGSIESKSHTMLQIERNHSYDKAFFNKIIGIYEEHTKMKRDEIEKALSDDCYYLDAKQCLKKGLCDEII